MGKLSEVIGRAKSWVDSNVEDNRVVSSALLDRQVLAKIYEHSKEKRPTLAVYGESQIGKSYLMSGLFKYQERFFIQVKGSHQAEFGRHIIDGKYVDFLNSINPSGGRESSGIVTRFTSSTAHQRDDAPLKVEFLRQVDLAMIIADTYSMDFDTDDSDLRYEELVKLLQESQSDASSPQDGMSIDDVVEFKLYAQKYLKSGNDVIKLVNRAGLWDKIIKIVPNLPYDKRYKILEIFWGRVPLFTQLFNHLSGVLKQLRFVREANLNLHALIPKKVGVTPASIIDVGTAKEVISQNKLDKRLKVYTKFGEFDDFYVGDITAIIRELTLTVDDRVVAQRSFLQDVDVLDFPGARNRKKFNIDTLKRMSRFDEFDIDEDEPLLHECLVRGKVNYLFNSYSDNIDITTLIFAQKYGNQEVNSLPKQIDNWVINTHGASPAERAGKGNNLFISFHFFNIELDGKEDEIEGDVEQYEEYWNNRFKNNVEKFISQQIRDEDNWIENWADGKRFKNFLFLRDPAFQKSVTVEGGIERYSSEKYQRKHIDMKRSFTTSPIVREFVENPLELWENSAELGKTGVDYIIEKAFSITSKEVRLRQINYRLHRVAREVLNLIQQFYQSGDFEKVIREAEQKSILLVKEILISMQNHNSFGAILEALNIEEKLSWQTMFDLKNPIFSYEENQNTSSEGNSRGEVNINLDDIIDTLGLGDKFEDILGEESSEENSTKVVKRKSDAESFADMLLQNWEEDVRAKLEPKLQSFDISSDSFEWLLQVIKEAGSRVEIKRKIAEGSSKFIEQYVGNNDIIYLVARVSKNYLNRHINSVGWGYVAPESRPKLNNQVPIFNSQREDFVYVSPDIEQIELLIKEIFDKKGNDFHFVGEKFFKEWLKGLHEAVTANIEFKFREGGIVSNPEENSKLGEILEELKKI